MTTPDLAKLTIVCRKTSELFPNIGNARGHSRDKVLQIAASMQKFAFTNPILIAANNEIIAGHGRLPGAQANLMVEVPTIEFGHLTTTTAGTMCWPTTRSA